MAFDFSIKIRGAPGAPAQFVPQGGKAGDPLLEGRKFDHDEALELVRSFHNLKTSAACQHLAAVLGDDAGDKVGVLFVDDGVDNA